MEKHIEVNGKEYTLKMNRAALRKAEQIGLDINVMTEQPITQSTYLFMAALWGGGSRLSDDKAMRVADDFFDSCEDVAEILGELAEMYAEVFRTRE